MKEQIKRLVDLILSNPADIKLLKQEYFQLTGKRFRRNKND